MVVVGLLVIGGGGGGDRWYDREVGRGDNSCFA